MNDPLDPDNASQGGRWRAVGAALPAIEHGLGLQAAGRLDEAVEEFRRALSLDPASADAACHLGVLLERRADYAGAEAAFRAALEVQPERADAWNDLGNCLQSQRREQEALAAYRRAADIAPESAEVACNIGTMLRATGAVDECVTAFERAIALAPGFADPHYHLAAARLARGEIEQAIASVECCLALEPYGQESLALLAFLLHEAGRDAEAARLFDFERFVRVVKLPTPPGFANIRAFNRVLSRHVLAHPSLVFEPYGASTRRGRHSADLLSGDKGPAAALEKLVQAALGEYVNSLPMDPGHPYLARVANTCRLVIQANLLDPGGFLMPHVHPASWVSGAYYLSLPEGLGAGGKDRAGWLEFGRPPPLVELEREPRTHSVRPAEGTLVLFPSYFYHGTVPLPGKGTRISVGIDLIPAA